MQDQNIKFNINQEYSLFFRIRTLSLFRKGIDMYTDYLKKWQSKGNKKLEEKLNTNEKLAKYFQKRIDDSDSEWEMVDVQLSGEILKLLKSLLWNQLNNLYGQRQKISKDNPPADAYEEIDAQIETFKEIMNAGQMGIVPIDKTLMGAAKPMQLQEPEIRKPLILDKELKETMREIGKDKNNDRVISDATIVLENRVRSAAGLKDEDIGVRLVKKAFQPQTGILVLSKKQKEQEGFCKLYEGAFMAFRNQVDHRRIKYTRERTMQIIGYLDYLIGLLQNATKRKQN